MEVSLKSFGINTFIGLSTKKWIRRRIKSYREQWERVKLRKRQRFESNVNVEAIYSVWDFTSFLKPTKTILNTNTTGDEPGG